MQTTENHSDRRSNPRRSDTRRSEVRLNRSFEVSVLNYDGKTVNVSARGAYFKVSNNDSWVFPIGASLPLLINVVTKNSKDIERKYRFSGRGTVVRNCIIQNSNQTNSLGVAFKFTEKLHIELDND